MKTLIIFVNVILFVIEANAKIIYIEPVQNAKHVSIHNNIIIGYDIPIIKDKDIPILIVVGSKSGNLTGEIIISKDNKKLIFKPTKPFQYNEIVNVKLTKGRNSKNISDHISFSFQTQIIRVEMNDDYSIINEMNSSLINTNTQNFNPLIASVLNLISSNNPTSGDLYLGNLKFGNPVYTPYLLISDNSGNYTYVRELSVRSFDFIKQPNGLLTYYTNGKYYVEDAQFNLLDSVECGNGYSTDSHELRILNNGHYLLMSYDPQIVDMSQIVPGGNSNATVIGLIIQELDEDKNVVFQWRSWDHFEITDAVHENLTASRVDYVHGNAIELDYDGNLLISSRHLSEITKINRSTGNIIWRLGGVNNQFTFLNDTIGFSYQHHIRRISNGNVTLFDNGNFHSPAFSRAIEYQLDEVNKIATLVWQYRKTPDVLGYAMGSVQRLHNGNTLICWGSVSPTITEVTPGGSIALEMNLSNDFFTYRVFRDEVDLTLNAKIAIEGFYNNISDRLNMNDTVRVYLRNTTLPFAIVDSALSVIDSTNFKGNFRFFNTPSGTYFLSTKHRNGLETWSKAGGELFTSGGVYQYDFTSTSSNSFGNNAVLKGPKYCFYSGDVNQDGIINISDVLLISNDAVNIVSGYAGTDVNGDNYTELSDLLIAYNNAINFVTSITP